MVYLENENICMGHWRRGEGMLGYPKPSGYPESRKDGYIGYHQGRYSQYLPSAKAQELTNQNVQAMLGSSMRSGAGSHVLCIPDITPLVGGLAGRAGSGREHLGRSRE